VTTRVRRSHLALRRLDDPPEPPPEGAELIYADATGALRQLDDLDNDSPIGGDASAAIAAHEAAGNPHPNYETSAEAQAKVDAAVAALVGAAPSTLNTLAEIATALASDPALATTLTALIGTKQPLDATLTALAAVVTAADKLIYATGVDTFSTATLSAFARTLLDDADAAAARDTLGAAAASAGQVH
jgi:hypothetical protein